MRLDLLLRSPLHISRKRLQRHTFGVLVLGSEPPYLPHCFLTRAFAIEGHKVFEDYLVCELGCPAVGPNTACFWAARSCLSLEHRA